MELLFIDVLPVDLKPKFLQEGGEQYEESLPVGYILLESH
jgi:hypothetical protein